MKNILRAVTPVHPSRAGLTPQPSPLIQLVGHGVVAIIEELHLPLLPGQVGAVLLEIVLHSTAAVLSILEPPVQPQHTALLGHQVPPHLLQGTKTDALCLHQSEQRPNTFLNVSQHWGLVGLSE